DLAPSKYVDFMGMPSRNIPFRGCRQTAPKASHTIIIPSIAALFFLKFTLEVRPPKTSQYSPALMKHRLIILLENRRLWGILHHSGLPSRFYRDCYLRDKYEVAQWQIA